MNAGDQGANEFVGRASELRQLTEAFEQTLDVHHSVIMVAGPSGIGKTALITQFLLSLVEAHPSLKVFKGRCYEFEPVPYKGLDTIADEIATHLQQLPADIVRAIVPEDGFLLARLFPSLRRVPAIRDAPVPPNVAPDAQEIRDGAFTAPRHLLLRMGRRAPTVLWLDDVQWSDRDSATFIADLCSSPEPHSLLVLLSYRNDGMTANPTLSLLHQVFGSDRFFGECKEVDVKPLSAEESRRLMEAFVSPGAVLSETARAQIIGEAGGHPLFLQQLTQFATSSESEASGKFSLDDLEVHAVLRSHTAALSDAAREILALTCIAAHPPALSLLLGAVEAPEAPKSQGVVELLHRRLARLEGLPEVPRLEPYHDQIRSAVCAMLDPGERQRCHTRLARLLSAQPNADPQLLVYHYLQAGETQAAFEAAVTSADLAESQFAFDRAASFYQIALALTPPANRIEWACFASWRMR